MKKILTITMIWFAAISAGYTQVNRLLECKESPIVLETATGKIFGTLTLPAINEKMPVVLFIAGSGPTDRDGNSMMIKTDAYKKVAQSLCTQGIAMVRYDKRGIGESKAAAPDEKYLRFSDYVKDVTEWVTMLKKDARFSSVIIIGHSEGSLIGLAAGNIADKFISISGAGRPADEVIKEQMASQPQAIRDVLFSKLDSMKAGFMITNFDKRLNGFLRISVQPYMISWLKYNPQELMKKMQIPVLIIQGTNDIQVTVEDAKLLSAANPSAKLVIIEKMNHILVTVEGDREANMATYGKPEIPLNNELVKTIATFIK